LICASALLTALACDHDGIDRDDWGDDDDGDDDAHEGAEPRSRGVNVVAHDGERNVVGLDILVHDADGKLLFRDLTAGKSVYLPADAGDSVSVVWRDHEASEGQGWVVDSVRVTGDEYPERARVSFRVKATPLPVEPNPQVQVEIETAPPPLVVQTYVALSCAEPALVSNGVAVFEDYQGCGGHLTSTATAVGLDAQGRIVAFGWTHFAHDAAVRITLPVPPVASVTPVYTATWTTADVAWLSGAADWRLGDWTLADPDPWLVSDPAPGTHYRPYVPLTPANGRVELRAGVQTGDGLCHELSFSSREYEEIWNLERLALPWLDPATMTWSIGSSGQPGDAIVIDLPYGTHRYRRVEPPYEQGVVFDLVFPELPEDLAAHFASADELGDWQIRNEDSADLSGYPGYLTESVGEVDRRSVRESSNAGPCVAPN
jgi:hypothetical protein